MTAWTQDLTARAIALAKAKASSIDAHCEAAAKQYGAAASELEVVYRTYLQGNKDRLESFLSSEVRGIKPSMGYVYVQAGRVLRDPASVGLDPVAAKAMAVQALAQFDRFIVPASATDEDREAAKTAAVELVKADTEKATAEGRKPLTADGLRQTSKAIKAETTGEAPEDPIERRTGNIAAKLRDELPKVLAQCEAKRQAKGPLAAGYALAIWAAEAGAKHGACTPQAIERLYVEAAAAKVQADRAEAKAEAEAEAKATEAEKVQAAVATLTPQATPKPKATVQQKATPKATPKRTSRRQKSAGGTAALVAANAPQDGQ